MAKYDEIMEKITLSPEARDRIIENVAKNVTSQPKKKNFSMTRLRKQLTMAACLVLVVGVAISAAKTDFFGLLGLDKGSSDLATEPDRFVSEEELNDESVQTEDGDSQAVEGEISYEEGASDLTQNNSAGENGSSYNTGENEPSDNTGGEKTENSVGTVTGDNETIEVEGEDLQPAETTTEDPAENSEETVLEEEMIKESEGKSFEVSGNGGVQSVWNVKEFTTEEELSEYLGFEVSCPEFIKISEDQGLTEITYRAYGDDMGEITITDGKAENFYRKAIGHVPEDEISGDYNEYSTAVEFDGETISGSLEGKGSKYTLAYWTSIDGYTYAAGLSKGLKADKWWKIIYGSDE